MSKKQKLTPWFPADVKPVHIGVYRVSVADLPTARDEEYAHWDGKRWGWGSSSVLNAVRFPAYESGYQQKKWRGLAVKHG